jgi:predicted permease
MKIILFPSFLATILALFTSRFINFELIFPFLDKIVATLSPLALFSVGLQIRFDNIRSEAQNLIAGLTYKLFIAPAIILAFLLIFSQKGNLANITIFEAAMPAHITASLLLSQNNINPKLCNLLVGIGIICSFFSSAFWYWICNIF